MSTSSSSSAPAPWRSLFLAHVDTMKTLEFTLSTIRRMPASPPGPRYGIPSEDGFVHVPRARTCIFRGMWANLPVNPKNDAKLNPDIWESDLLTFTTDVRMDKLHELFEAEAGHQEHVGKGSNGGRFDGTGGGGPVEAVFWAETPMVQWRVRGRAYVLGPDVEGESQGAREARTRIRERLCRKKDAEAGREKSWSWAREITAQFGNLSPGMRGTFRNPPPGTPVSLPVDGGLGLGQKLTGLDDEVARRNFRVVVILPFEVDRCDLSDPERGRRWIYRFAGGETEPLYPGGQIIDGWEKVETWP